MQLTYPASGQPLVYEPPTQVDLELEQVADRGRITEFERTSIIWAQHQAPLNVAQGMFSLIHPENSLKQPVLN